MLPTSCARKAAGAPIAIATTPNPTAAKTRNCARLHIVFKCTYESSQEKVPNLFLSSRRNGEERDPHRERGYDGGAPAPSFLRSVEALWKSRRSRAARLSVQAVSPRPATRSRVVFLRNAAPKDLSSIDTTSFIFTTQNLYFQIPLFHPQRFHRIHRCRLPRRGVARCERRETQHCRDARQRERVP
jgi:hypothetical protein